ncbi:hypothetical protein C3489_29930 [Streptomyces sp. Ru71]|uniref:hypothetical protein n=1 Tax=Streptomyces sp. Ru71 TaxID=2080746 RepID=UPI000CDE55CE|nr:hypothetical protein [Streptomyces sp. Ru71]POX47316.1 hypothetical protein C3489_29930 [Streptomyces sp. Ru71]
MHTYDVPRRQSFSTVPPPPRPGQEPQRGPSATPIYDALYAEYVKSFRSLPGDRSGEEELGFTAFGNIPHSGRGGPRPGSFSSSYSAYSAGAHSARVGRQSVWQRVGPVGQQGGAMQYVPALPPARPGGS